MKQIILRLKAETPVFFKRLRNASVYVATACTGMSIYYGQIPEKFASFIPANVVTCIATAGFVAAFISQLTKKDNHEPVS